jgi:glycosyltransferase involved in cell wall biosynthesis
MYPPHSLGGYEIIWAAAMQHLRASGHTVRVLTTDYRREGISESESEGDVHRELRWYWRDHDFPRLGPRARLAIERHNAVTFERHLDEFRPNLVSWWAMGGMSLSLIERWRRSRGAAAGVVCDDWMIYGPRVDAWQRPFRARPRLGRLVERLTGIPTRVELERAAEWLFLSETLLERARGLAAVDPPDPVVARRGVDPTIFFAAPEEQWSWRLLYVGRLDPRKGVDLAVHAVAGLPPEASLRILGAGDDEYLRELQDLAKELDLRERVSFGTADYGQLRDAYAGADAVVFPVRWEEPWGLVPLEAMAVGTPVIATGRGGSGEYLEDGRNCLLFDPDDGPEALAGALRRLAADEALRARLREGGLQTASALRAEDWNREVERAHVEAASS